MHTQAGREAPRVPHAGAARAPFRIHFRASAGDANNNNKYAYAGQLNSFTLLIALVVLHDRGILGPLDAFDALMIERVVIPYLITKGMTTCLVLASSKLLML
jgi:hypothetical protein